MSLAINVDLVEAVLLGDTWYDVADDSFTMDAYEFIWHPSTSADPMTLHGGGQGGVCSTGFEFQVESGSMISGPLTAIQAVRHRLK